MKKPVSLASRSPSFRTRAARALKCRPTDVVFLLRTCNAHMKAHDDFQWPARGLVKAPDWRPTPACGHGLHGLPKGVGDPALLSSAADAKWLVIAAKTSEVVDIDGQKSKAPRAWVAFVGARDDAVAVVQSEHPEAADRCVYGRAEAGYAGTATAGYAGTATAGDAGTATAGYAGTATAGYAGTATAGYAGTATAGYAGTATAGEGGSVLVSWWDTARKRKRTKHGECGIDVQAWHAYRVSDAGAWLDFGDVREICGAIEAFARGVA